MRASMAYMDANEWVSTWLEVVGAVVIMATCVFSVWECGRGRLSVSEVGFVLSYCTQASDLLAGQLEDPVLLISTTNYNSLVFLNCRCPRFSCGLYVVLLSSNRTASASSASPSLPRCPPRKRRLGKHWQLSRARQTLRQ